METSNPYQPPQSDLSATPGGEEYQDRPWYSPSGRLGRARYFLSSVGYYLLFVLTMALMSALAGSLNTQQVMPLLMVPAFLAYAIFSLFLAIKRIHDLDWSAWLLLLLLVPLVNLVMTLLLLFKSGSDGVNRFGAPARPAKNAVLWVVLGLIFIFVAGMIAATSIPAYQQYIARTAQHAK